jgi:hypothetical protein
VITGLIKPKKTASVFISADRVVGNGSIFQTGT